ncbi:uncharacterized protein LOC113295281 [Papaver somniferum]|uniref:uncharacterized protein LOC113295281 n=1 Tax=Papaver somniferum TaxID=3469 RepID=UPI000E703A24|nr:uncharacterized protein LOC113295281 [Papaver somniferum]
MGVVIGKVVSSQQGAFIKGRGIHEKIVLASELINELNFKRRRGNVGLKLDITQAYDSLSWSFLFEALRYFGFSEIGINWMKTIFQSAKIYVLVNGGPCGFFDQVSGQVVSKAKSKLFVGGVLENRKKIIFENMQMEISEFPDKYLGVILNPGRVKKDQVWGIVEMLQKLLAGWMGKILAFSDRLVLVKSVFCSIPIHNMSVYRRPSAVVKECERIIKNFLWSGDPTVKKLVTIKWDEVCAPMEEGGLGIRILEVVNKALLLKLLWRIETEDKEWTRFMKEKYKNKKGEWRVDHNL